MELTKSALTKSFKLSDKILELLDGSDSSFFAVKLACLFYEVHLGYQLTFDSEAKLTQLIREIP